jgi:protein-S-isoprenylcysteine O-methyltransferase Ste14
MSISTALAAKIVWLLGIVAWYVIRYPFERRAKRVRVVTDRRSLLDRVGLASAVLGMAVLPAIYVFTGFPEAADYPATWWAVALGAAIVVAGLWTFRRSHKELGRNWSITLEIRDEHRLVSSGPYALVRHPMYTSFFLIALGQLFLLPNLFAGPIGLVGFAVLFFVRVAKEERMMLETFGPQYTTYMERTKRLIPYIY